MDPAVTYFTQNQYLYYFLNFSRYGLEIVVATVLLIPWKKHRGRFALKSVLCFIANLAVCALMAIPEADEVTGEHSMERFFAYLLIYCVIIVWLFISYKDSLWNMVFYFISGNALRSFVYKLYQIIISLVSLDGMDINMFDFGTLLNFVTYYPLLVGVYAAVYFTLGRALRRQGDFALTVQSVAVYVVIVLLNTCTNYVESFLYERDTIGYLFTLVTSAVFNLLILIIQLIILRETYANADKVVLQRLLDGDKKQYEQLKENMDIINVKCHDLRHQIRALKAGGLADGKYLDELADSIAVYDSTVKTGNEALDVILTDKKLVCEKSGIQLTCIADGALLSFMEVSDLYSLFGNLLDNAIEYLRQIAEGDKRFISLTVSRSGGLVCIHQENYFEGELLWRGGLPQTTKGDTVYHGYGVKSIKGIAEKYGGRFRAFVEDGLYQTDICFPEN